MENEIRGLTKTVVTLKRKVNVMFKSKSKCKEEIGADTTRRIQQIHNKALNELCFIRSVQLQTP
jgi:hypothetical protein